MDPNEAPRILNTHICGTVACALGHTPAAFPDFNWDAYTKNWWGVAEDFFGITGLGELRPLWSFLFGPYWAFNCDADYDKTSYAVADRIAAVLYEDFQVEDHRPYEGMDKVYGAAKRAGWITRQKMARKVSA
jgi:hypothetical protein